MVTVSLPELEDVARALAPARLDDYSTRALGRAYEEYVARQRRSIAPFSIAAGGRAFATFYAVLTDPTVRVADCELVLAQPPAAGPLWDFLQPFERVAFRPDGTADLVAAGGTAQRAVARVLLREHFIPRTRAEEDRAAAGGARVQLPGLIGTLDQGVGICRTQGVLPFAVAVELYLAETRVRVEFDLIHMLLLADPRAGRLPAARRVGRPSRLDWAIDRKIGAGDLSLLAARCLETLSESNGLSSVELTHVFGGVRELVDSAVQGLVQQRLVTFDRRTGIYRARLEAFQPTPAPASTDEAPLAADPALRTSVQELIAAADARATCPLCGRPLPPVTGTILCADCAAMVGPA